jgi:hypothetical protein
MNNEICFEDYVQSPYKKGISNYKLTGRCEDCQKFFAFKEVKNFRRRDWNKKELCQKCYLKHRCYLNEDWIKKNSEAQLIAQNKPEQKLKNSIAVSKSKRWTDEKRLAESEKMKEKWRTASESDKQKMLSNLDWTNKNNDRFNLLISKSSKNQKTGYYNNIFYNSILELSFLIECDKRLIPVKRYDLPPIDYKDFNNKNRKYFPDFIIYGKIIVEIKGHIFKGEDGQKTFILKNQAAKKFCSCHNLKFRVFFRSDFLKRNERVSKTIHENSIKAIQAI